MKKRTTNAFRKRIYLLGKNHEGRNVWLEQATWDCEWYWGLGYVETYTNNASPNKAKDIESHQHFDCLFFNKNKNGYDAFKEFMQETPLNDKEIWQLLELMKTAYNLRHYADMMHRGGAHYTTNSCADIIKNEDEYNRINKVCIPRVMEEIYKLLSPSDEQ